MADNTANILFLKIALDAVFLELADGGQAVHRVPGKPADALGHDEVDFPGQRIRDHAFEALAVLGAGAGYAFVGVHVHELPVIPALDVIGVVVDLRLVARELVVVIRGDAGVSCHPALFLLRNRRSGKARQRGRDGFYFFALVDAQYFSLLIFFMFSLIFCLRSSVKLALMASTCFSLRSGVHPGIRRLVL